MSLLKFTGSKFVANFLAFHFRGLAIDVSSADSGLEKLLLNMLCVRAIDRENQSWPSNGMFQPSGDDIGHQWFLIHRNGQFAFVIIAGNGMDSRQVRMRRRKNPELGEKTFVDKLLNASDDNQF